MSASAIIAGHPSNTEWLGTGFLVLVKILCVSALNDAIKFVSSERGVREPMASDGA